ncbi:MAG: 7-cyano-7-deazaguanine synthase QueC [Candidatus Omnitrophica bacterium]|nr:7-cyano-7-deazaguanine synthase QueC [Candidatus Omnitrophota bacterium]
MKKKKAVVLLSGGMDSAVTLYMARQDYQCHALIFDYGQKAVRETGCARKVAQMTGSPFYVLRISFPWKGSALLDALVDVPAGAVSGGGNIPSTYVPARNIVFLSFGVSFAEAIDAEALFIGAHQLDFSNYPDCRTPFFESFQETVRQGTKKGVEGRGVRIVAPIIDRTKKEIIEAGLGLGVAFEHTWSCYKGGALPCGACESCMFRAAAFAEAGIPDPLLK